MANGIPFATEAWIRRFGEECNNSPAYRQAARNWEGDLYLVVEAQGNWQKPVYMYLDLYHGECRQAFIPEDHTALTPEFIISGPLSAWKELAERKIDPMRALMTRKLSLKGNLAKVMQNARAANELVNCTTRFETAFPAE